ncbi:hypothetical protein B7R22_05400 [Subtercola boreus]|uniref:Uncharacterized protein n=1 Tax=Subtercola boreus TaxID=120213 RepID=A0A3E0W0F2_9MICO|nr:hypothetical protein [Subtercola boreus]RFA15844.1 hypothetical protein B7R22_05400 [Subtercola boreus]
MNEMRVMVPVSDGLATDQEMVDELVATQFRKLAADHGFADFTRPELIESRTVNDFPMLKMMVFGSTAC